ncbi:hypothetical protein OG741_02735 [Streptomyces sp. NBC_01410]|uniref:hypothetical protein n=1 Tax=Streptomyces sp. NBC_01410 TaxID=2903856 RepID=UPI00324CD9ED
MSIIDPPPRAVARSPSGQGPRPREPPARRARRGRPQTNGVVEWFFGTLKYEHLNRATIGDDNHARFTSPSNTAMSVWPLADRLPDREVLT